LDGAISGEL